MSTALEGRVCTTEPPGKPIHLDNLEKSNTMHSDILTDSYVAKTILWPMIYRVFYHFVHHATKTLLFYTAQQQVTNIALTGFPEGVLPLLLFVKENCGHFQGGTLHHLPMSETPSGDCHSLPYQGPLNGKP